MFQEEPISFNNISFLIENLVINDRLIQSILLRWYNCLYISFNESFSYIIGIIGSICQEILYLIIFWEIRVFRKKGLDHSKSEWCIAGISRSESKCHYIVYWWDESVYFGSKSSFGSSNGLRALFLVAQEADGCTLTLVESKQTICNFIGFIFWRARSILPNTPDSIHLTYLI